MEVTPLIRRAVPFSGLAACLLLGSACAGRTSTASQEVPAGLWDAHTHLTWWGADALDSLDKYGIVAVRDLGSDAVVLAKWRDEIAQGKRRGPRIFFAGGQIDGPRDNPQWRSIVRSEEDVRRVVDSLAGLGVSFLKTHNQLKPALFFAVLREARRHGLPVAAHLPEGVAAWTAADSGVASLEHMAESIMISPVHAGFATTLREALEWWRSPAGDTMVAHLARTGVAVTPTLAAYQEFAREKGVSEQSRAGRFRALEFQKQLTGRFSRAGITILAGSDFADKDWTVAPGAILYEEIRLLEESGLTREDARRAASTSVEEWIKRRR